MQDLNDLYFFVQVVDHGGFASAARALGMPRSRLSRRIALLEERLGVRLIQRSTRRFSVTEIGQDYYRHCVAMLVEADAAAAGGTRPRRGRGRCYLRPPAPRPDRQKRWRERNATSSGMTETNDPMSTRVRRSGYWFTLEFHV